MHSPLVAHQLPEWGLALDVLRFRIPGWLHFLPDHPPALSPKWDPGRDPLFPREPESRTALRLPALQEGHTFRFRSKGYSLSAQLRSWLRDAHSLLRGRVG